MKPRRLQSDTSLSIRVVSAMERVGVEERRRDGSEENRSGGAVRKRRADAASGPRRGMAKWRLTSGRRADLPEPAAIHHPGDVPSRLRLRQGRCRHSSASASTPAFCPESALARPTSHTWQWLTRLRRGGNLHRETTISTGHHELDLRGRRLPHPHSGRALRRDPVAGLGGLSRRVLHRAAQARDVPSGAPPPPGIHRAIRRPARVPARPARLAGHRRRPPPAHRRRRRRPIPATPSSATSPGGSTATASPRVRFERGRHACRRSTTCWRAWPPTPRATTGRSASGPARAARWIAPPDPAARAQPPVPAGRRGGRTSARDAGRSALAGAGAPGAVAATAAPTDDAEDPLLVARAIDAQPEQVGLRSGGARLPGPDRRRDVGPPGRLGAAGARARLAAGHLAQARDAAPRAGGRRRPRRAAPVRAHRLRGAGGRRRDRGGGGRGGHDAGRPSRTSCSACCTSSPTTPRAGPSACRAEAESTLRRERGAAASPSGIWRTRIPAQLHGGARRAWCGSRPTAHAAGGGPARLRARRWCCSSRSRAGLRRPAGLRGARRAARGATGVPDRGRPAPRTRPPSASATAEALWRHLATPAPAPGASSPRRPAGLRDDRGAGRPPRRRWRPSRCSTCSSGATIAPSAAARSACWSRSARRWRRPPSRGSRTRPGTCSATCWPCSARCTSGRRTSRPCRTRAIPSLRLRREAYAAARVPRAPGVRHRARAGRRRAPRS